MAEILEIGISTTFNYGIPFKSMVRMIKEAGFTALSLGGGNVEHSGYDKREGRRAIKKVLRAHEMILDSIHAPFGEKRDISNSEPRIRSLGCNGIRNTLDACHELGTEVAIVHLNSRFPESEYEERQSAVRMSLEQLIPPAQTLGVKLTVENLPHPNSLRLFNEILESYPELKVCYDSSHAYMNGAYFGGNSLEILGKYFDRIVAVHLSDGYRNVDDHLPLYQGKIDWDDFGKHFSKTTYRGTLLLEIEMKATHYKDPVLFLAKAYEGAAQLLETIQRAGR